MGSGVDRLGADSRYDGLDEGRDDSEASVINE